MFSLHKKSFAVTRSDSKTSRFLFTKNASVLATTILTLPGSTAVGTSCSAPAIAPAVAAPAA